MAQYYGGDDFFSNRMDADFETATLEQAGANLAYLLRKAKRLIAAGTLEAAAIVCPHGWGYPLRSEAATRERDPQAGGDGWRCKHCGSRLSNDPLEGDFAVDSPCEIAPSDGWTVPA